MQIEKGIPIPDAKPRQPRGVSALVRQMEVGDSIFYPNRTSVQMGAIMAAWKRFVPTYKFTARNVEGGVRVWRIE